MTYYFYYSDAYEKENPRCMLAFCNVEFSTVEVVKKFTKSASILTPPISHYVGSHVDENGKKFETFRELQKFTYIMSGIVIKEDITYD